MFQILVKYLLVNRQVNLPGVGVFNLVHHPARFDVAAKQINPPATVIEFSGRSATADKSFFQFASSEMQVEDWDTIRRFHDFSFKIKNELDAERSVNLPGIGLLTKDDAGNIAFKQRRISTEFLPVVSMEGIYQVDVDRDHLLGDDNAGNEVLPGEVEAASKSRGWWIAAIIITVLSVAAIVYYFTTLNVKL